MILTLEVLESRITPSTLMKQDNIAYGTDPAQVLDVEWNTGFVNAPAVVLLHGGGWFQGDKQPTENEFAKYFVGQGFVVMAPDYRLVTANGQGGYDNRFPTGIDDVASAIAWFQQSAALYGANPQDLLLLGHSAGAQIGAMLAFDPTGENNWGLPSPLTGIVGFVGDSGAYDFPLMSSPQAISRLANYLGPLYGMPQWDVAEPITYASSAVPTLIIDGTADNLTNYFNSTAFVNALQAAGDNVTYQLYPGYTHGEFTNTFASSTAEQDMLTAWLQSIGLP